MTIQLINDSENTLKKTAEKTLMDYIVSGDEADRTALFEMDDRLSSRGDLRLACVTRHQNKPQP